MSKTYLAMVKTPLGVWDSTACVCSGHEAEYRARSWAKLKFFEQVCPPFMTKGLDGAAASFWSAAQANGCSLIEREVEINPKQSI